MSLFKCKKCQGMVVESDKVLDTERKTIEFVCLHCGNRLNMQTERYIKLLDALKVDYSRRVK